MTWDLLYDWRVYLLTTIAVLVALTIARAWAISPSLRSYWFFIPRLLVIGLLLLILMNPVEESRRRLPPRRPPVSCLIDGSRSMGLDRPTTRIEAVKQVVFDAQADLERKSGAQMQLYRFGSRFASVPSLSDMRAEQERSRLHAGLADLVTLFQDEPPKAVVVFSDGILPDQDALAKVAEDYRRLGIPIHVFPVGSDNIRGDIAIASLSIPKGVKPGDQVPIRFVIRNQGFDGERLVVQVRPEASADLKPLAELPITLRNDSQSFELVVPADPKAGRLVLSVPEQEGEAIESNNKVPFELVARDRRLKVFYMEGTTQNVQYRYVRDALQEDPNITCVSSTVDDQWVRRPRLMRIDDPLKGFPSSREELFEYDVVICSDISRGAFTREQLDWTVELVRDRGGGFVMVGGHTSFGAGGWDQTVWDQLIPIDMRGSRIGRGFVHQTIHIEIPDDAADHPIWRIVDDPTQNNRILDAMPYFHGTNVAKRVKPAATLLGQSRNRLTLTGRSPIFACQPYGRGRSFAMMTDTTEWWGERFERLWGQGDNRYFRKFWRNVVNWLAENSVSGRRRLVVATDKLIYLPGDTIQLDVEAYDDDFKSTTEYRLEAELLNSSESTGSKTRCQPSVQGSYTGEIVAARPRAQSDDEASTLSTAVIRVTAWDGNEQIVQQDTELQVLTDSDELLDPMPNHQVLKDLAKKTNGIVLSSSNEITQALVDLPVIPGEQVVHRSPRWDRPWMWCMIVILLVLEWILRRRFGLRPSGALASFRRKSVSVAAPR